jgi:gliding motility-associated-like protein
MNTFPDRGGCPRSCFIIKRTLQLGPDGKIYISQREVIASGPVQFDRNVNVIEYSDRNRDDAYYRRNYLDIGNPYKFINVNYIRSGSFSSRENGILAKKKICLGLPTDFSLLYTRIDSVKWDFGDPGSGTNNYSAAISPSHNYGATGTYTIKAIIYKYCSIDTAITRVSIDPDPIVHIPAYIKDTIVCIGSKLNIDAATPNATTYQWKDGLIYSYREITASGNFLVRAFNACSDDQKSFTVSFAECPCDVFTPTAFTPDNNGLNDNFRPIIKCIAKDYQLKVFNRYGNIVFSSSELNKGWDGKNKYFFSPTGVYAWMLQFRNPNNNQVIRKQGIVTLIR